MSSRRTQLAVIAALAALIVAVAIVVSQLGGEAESGEGDDLDAQAAEVERLFAGIPQAGARLGDPNAPITVSEWVDLQCPFCAEFSRRVLPEVIERHVRGGEVALELRILSFLGEDSREAAEVAAAAALQDRIWQFTDLFYLNQGAENSGFVTDDFLAEIAGATPGLDAERALEQRSSPEASALLDEAEAMSTRLGVDSTPSFYATAAGSAPQRMELEELTAQAFTDALDSALGR